MRAVHPATPRSKRAHDNGTQKPVRPGVRLAGYAFFVVLSLGVAEVGLFLLPMIAGKDLVAGRLYTVPDLKQAEYNDYLAIRDPVLGWPAPQTSGHGDYDASGARLSPAYPTPGNECVTLYGDSFTFGDEVGNAEAWGNLLAQRLGCRVGNFGVKGYGTDQALLRFKASPGDTSKVAVLGIYADNLLRNVNQQNYFVSGSTVLAMKPRFLLDGDVLRLVAIPSLTYAEMLVALHDPKSVWKEEFLLPGSADGPIDWSFPYTFSFARMLTSHHLWDFVSHRPRWIDFYRNDHPSRALPITIAIAEEFRRVADQRGKSAVVVLFPPGPGYDVFRRTGVSPFQPLIDALKQRNIETLDVSEDFSRYLKERNFCEMVVDAHGCRGHNNAEANGVIADAVNRYLVAGKLLRQDR